MSYFIQNPINYTIQPIDKSADKVTFHRVIAEVTVGGMTFTQSEPVNSETSSVVFDISTSLRAYADSTIYSAVVGSETYSPIEYSVKFHDEYMQAGRIQKSPDRSVSSGTAIVGGYTDFERLTGAGATSAETADYTLRPSSPYILPSGADYLCYRRTGATRTARMRSAISPEELRYYDTGSGYPVTDNGRWTAFQFINTRGLHETAFAQCYSSEQIKGGTQTHVRALRETFAQMSHRLGVPDPAYAALSFSSGFVDLPWAKWWAYEFCKSKHHWMLIDGIWLPCKVEIKDGASIINRTKTELLSVEFDVVPDVNGLI